MKKPYTRLWHLMLKQGDTFEALFAVEEGRAQETLIRGFNKSRLPAVYRRL